MSELPPKPPGRAGNPTGGMGAADRTPQNIQDSFLNQLRRERTPVFIFLVSGVKLSGRIRSFDKYSLVLESEGHEQLVFKHAIATVVTSRPAGGAGPP